MLARVVIAVTCSFIAATLVQLKNNRERLHNRQCDTNEGKEIYTYADASATTKEEREEEVKRVNSPALSASSFHDGEQILLPEFGDLVYGGLELPSDSEKSVSGPRTKYESDDATESKRYDSSSEDDEVLEIFEALASSNKSSSKDINVAENQSFIIENDPNELMQLKALVANLQQKEMKLEAELLEYYGLKEQERNYLELESQLQKKSLEIHRLNAKLVDLENEANQLRKRVDEKEDIEKELKIARAKIKDLQKAIQSDTGETKAQLLMLKQQVSQLQEREQEAFKRDMDLEKKLQLLKELEIEVVELRRTSKEFQHEKRELTIKLAAAEARIGELSGISESELVLRAQAEVSSLRLANEDLHKQVEGLQMNRFTEVEELVYLRWVNACLRYELRNHKTSTGKTSALELGKSLSPRSQEKAKQLMLEWVGPDILAAKAQELSEQECDSTLSFPSTSSEGDSGEVSLDGHSTRHSSFKKSTLIGKLKKWGKSRDDSHSASVASSSDLKNAADKKGHRRSTSKGSLDNLILRNNSDSVAITTFGTNEFSLGRLSSDSAPLDILFINTASSDKCDDISNSVAASFQLMSRTAGGELEEKYPAFKDRHKLAVVREKTLKEKADQARSEKFAEKRKADQSPLMSTLDRGMPGKCLERFNFEQKPDVVLASERTPVRPLISKMKFMEIEKRATRVPTPPPKPSVKKPAVSMDIDKRAGSSMSPPTPPPPPRAPGGPPAPSPPGSVKLQGAGGNSVQRAPELVEFYQSLMRREAKKDSVVGAAEVNVSDARNNVIGEIENRSTFLLAVKADVETQGAFVQSLATEVRNAAYDAIDDVTTFVSWLDEELSFLVDERAVLKHFDWPESKADALREAAFEYQDLKKLEIEISSFEDDPLVPCEASLKKMLSLLEKTEESVYALLRTRDMAIARYKEYNIPTQWLLDSGLIGKIKLAAVQLARKYMKRIATELDSLVSSAAKVPQTEFLLLQGVRFAFRVHQFAGGFDGESMRAFEELRDRVRMYTSDHKAN